MLLLLREVLGPEDLRPLRVSRVELRTFLPAQEHPGVGERIHRVESPEGARMWERKAHPQELQLLHRVPNFALVLGTDAREPIGELIGLFDVDHWREYDVILE